MFAMIALSYWHLLNARIRDIFLSFLPSFAFHVYLGCHADAVYFVSIADFEDLFMVRWTCVNARSMT